MPFATFSASVSDSGEASLGGSRVFYVAWEVTTPGPGVIPGPTWDPYTRQKVGFWQLGNDLTSLGIISAIGYDAPHWMNFLVGQWIVSPTADPAGFTTVFADHIRWALTPGTVATLYVFGDS